MAGIGQKVKDVAHKMGIGNTHREDEVGRHTGTEYENVGSTYGAAGAPGVTAPVVPGATTTGTGPLEGGLYEAERAAGTGGAYGTERAPGTGGAYGTEGTYGEGAYGTQGTYDRERREGYETTTAAAPGAVVEGGGRPEMCGAETFTKVQDRPVVKERVQQVVEHRPVEKEFVVETRQTGVERETGAGEVEHLGTTERVVGVAPPRAPCE